MSTVKKISYTISIDRLIEDDAYATIESYNTDNNADNEDMGIFLNWTELELVNNIISPESATSKITLITSNYYNAYNGFNSNDDKFYVEQMYDQFDTFDTFMKDLIGRKITVNVLYRTDEDSFAPEDKIIYVGYISKKPENVTVTGGAKFIIECLPLIAALDTLSPNVSWEQSTKTYGGVYTRVTGNNLELPYLDTLIKDKTILKDSNITYVTAGDAMELPDQLWTFLVPNKSRLNTIRELLCIYSRLFYQRADGELVISSLFIDDWVNDKFNVNASNNFNENWLAVNGVNNSINLPNRVDVYLGINPPVLLNGESEDNQFIEIIASAPYTKDDMIVAIDDSNAGYDDIYKTSARLYNSGYWIKPEIRNIALDNALTSEDSVITANILKMYSSKQLLTSNTNLSSTPNNNSMAQLYAQLYLAEVNTGAYNALIVYDYLTVVQEEDPLGKVINISNLSSLDYDDNLVSGTTLSVNAEQGAIFMIETVPLLSILPAWYEKGVQE